VNDKAFTAEAQRGEPQHHNDNDFHRGGAEGAEEDAENDNDEGFTTEARRHRGSTETTD
jgi:hypothetical protein